MTATINKDSPPNLTSGLCSTIRTRLEERFMADVIPLSGIKEVIEMLKPVAFAHAATIITAVFYVVCAALSVSAPDLLFSIVQPWVHSLNLQAIKITEMPSFGSLIIGLITISLITWVTTYATIELYNRLAKGK